MRVPIENGSGFCNQVSDFIKLPATLRQKICKELSNFKLTGCGFIIPRKNPIDIDSSC